MNDEATNEIKDGDRPVALVRSVQLTEVLGHIASDDAETGKGGAPNSTRWVFDITCTKAAKVKVVLVRHQDGLPFETDIEPSFHFTGMSKDFREANVWGKTQGNVLGAALTERRQFIPYAIYRRI